MAEKMVFIRGNSYVPYKESIIQYEFFPGFAISQKKKNVQSIRRTLNSIHPEMKVLEVSSKSDTELGIALSAFNLKLGDKFLECIFQSSKVFTDGSQYLELLDVTPLEAKNFMRELKDKRLKCFRYNNVEYPLKPLTAFYDYFYIQALKENKELSNQLLDYDIFTDVEFNHKKSLNCQARTCAIYSFLLKNNMVEEYTKDFNSFIKIYKRI